MRFISIVALILLAACGGATAPDPDAQWVGTWNAVSLNGSALPVAHGVWQTRAVYRRLTLASGHAGQWNDSTQHTYSGTTYSDGNHYSIYWWKAGNQIHVNAQDAWFSPLTFSIQADGSLLETEQDAAQVIYHR